MSRTGRPRGLVVANPVAGGDVAARVAELIELAGVAVDLETVWTSRRDEAVEVVARTVAFSRQEGMRLDTVVSVGGDGTAREVSEGLARGLGRWPHGRTHAGRAGADPVPVPALLVVPAGTGNSVYRAVWADRPWHQTVAEVLGLTAGPSAAKRRDLDLARLAQADRAVLLGATSGFLAEVTRAASQMPEVRGRERYQAAAAQVLAELRPYAGRVVVDGAVLVEGLLTLVAVGGARHRAGTFELLPRSVLDDGLLDVCTVGEVTLDRFGALASLLLDGRHLGEPEVSYGQGRQMVLERTDAIPLAFEHDGDVWTGADTSLAIEVVPGAVPVYAPLQAQAG